MRGNFYIYKWVVWGYEETQEYFADFKFRYVFDNAQESKK